MKLFDLKKVFKSGCDTTDQKWDMLTYVNIQAVNDEVAKMIDVVDVDTNRIAPLKLDFDGFLKKHRAFMNKYIKLLYTEEYAEELINLSHDDFCEVVLCESDVIHDFMNDEYDTIKDILK